MQRSARIVLFALIFVTAVFSNGCIDKTFYPATEIIVARVEPYALFPTATDSASLPTTQIKVSPLSKIPCTLKAVSCAYFTSIGEEITNLRVSNQPMEMQLKEENPAVDNSINIIMNIYPKALVDVFELSSSDISPVTARMTFHFNDVNGNWVNLEANCLLYKYEEAAAGSRREP